MSNIIGQSATRQDARLKVTGAAKYSAEFDLPRLAHAVLVISPVARGTIKSLNLADARAATGVIDVFSHFDQPKYGALNLAELGKVGTIPGEFRPPFSGPDIAYNGQAIAIVVADTYERARWAASLVSAEIETEQPAVGLQDALSATKPERFFGMEDAQYSRGEPVLALENAPFKVSASYHTPTEHHNPIEPHAIVADWQGDNLTIYLSSQGVKGPQLLMSQLFEIPTKNVRAISHFIGGGFGCKGAASWPHEIACVWAARQIGRPVKLALMRQQMFAGVGHRGECEMELDLGARNDGDLAAMSFRNTTQTHEYQPAFFEPSAFASRLLYDVPNYEMAQINARNNIAPPIFMRAPGEAPGVFALECAMDEMAHELKLDPIEFRLKNYADKNPQNGLPWSSKQLKTCYARGADLIGWNQRKIEPRASREGRYLTGYGVATATYPGYRTAASARCRIYADGRAVAGCAGSDIGTGAYTVFRQVAAQTLGFPLYKVVFELGDSDLPFAPVAGGSQLTASVAPAVAQACEMAMEAVAKLAIADHRSPLHGRKLAEIRFRDGLAVLKSDGTKGEALSRIVQRNNKPFIEACCRAETMASAKDSAGLKQKQKPPCAILAPQSETGADMEKYAFHSFGAQFCKLRVDEELGTIRLMDWVSVIDCGNVLNPRTARSQILGGVGFGIGMALSEETLYDPPTGRPIIRNLADYHVAVNADVPAIQVEFLNVPDPHINSLGCRGIGEIGITGVAAAIANAVFNATGKRLRDLPLTPDKFV